MSGLGWRVLGVDLSLPMLAEGQTRGSAGRLVLGDALQLPYADGCCSVAGLITVLEFLPDVEAALREAWRVARQGLLVGAINRHSVLGWGYRLQAKKAPTVYSHAPVLQPWRADTPGAPHGGRPGRRLHRHDPLARTSAAGATSPALWGLHRAGCPP